MYETFFTFYSIRDENTHLWIKIYLFRNKMFIDIFADKTVES